MNLEAQRILLGVKTARPVIAVHGDDAAYMVVAALTADRFVCIKRTGPDYSVSERVVVVSVGALDVAVLGLSRLSDPIVSSDLLTATPYGAGCVTVHDLVGLAEMNFRRRCSWDYLSETDRVSCRRNMDICREVAIVTMQDVVFAGIFREDRATYRSVCDTASAYPGMSSIPAPREGYDFLRCWAVNLLIRQLCEPNTSKE